MRLSRLTPALVAAALLGMGLPLMADPSLPAPPAGFTVLPPRPSDKAMKANGIADKIEAEKESDSSCKNAPRITLGYGWQLAPGGNRTVELMARTPQDPTSEISGIRREPAGRRRYKDGVLQWEKRTLLLSTGCPAGFVTYDGGWLGYVSGKQVTVGVTNVTSKEAGQALIDEYIDKVVAAVNAGAAGSKE